MRKLHSFFALAVSFVLQSGFASAQTVNYQPMITGSLPAIDLTKPVGTIEGAAGVSGSGAATYIIPIKVAPGTKGMEPALSLEYNSQGGNGILGWGWSLSGFSAVTRSGKDNWHDEEVSPTSLTNADHFLLDGLLLIPSGANGGNGTTYSTDVETYSVTTSYGTFGSGPQWFKVWAKDGSVLEYGNTTDSRILVNNGTEIIAWKLNKKMDVHGNYIEYKYTNSGGENRLDEIWYTGNAALSLLPYAHVKFNYVTGRVDDNKTFEAGNGFTSTHLLETIDVFTENNQFVRNYFLNYANDGIHSYLQSVTETGQLINSFNAVKFKYVGFTGSFDAPIVMSGCTTTGTSIAQTTSGDFDGDGYSDILEKIIVQAAGVWYTTGVEVKLRTPGTNSFGTPVFVRTMPSTAVEVSPGVATPHGYSYQVSDFDGDGAEDVLLVYTRLLSIGHKYLDSIVIVKKLGSPSPIVTKYIPPYLTGFTNAFNRIDGSQQCTYIGDFDGDGISDFLIVVSDDPSNTAGQWKAFMTCPGKGLINEEVYFNPAHFMPNTGAPIIQKILNSATSINSIDLDGDNKNEIFFTRLIAGTTPMILKYYVINFVRNNAFGTWNAVKIDDGGFSSNDQLIYFGDFNGDRKTDLLTRDNFAINKFWEIAYSSGKTFVSATSNFLFNTAPICTDCARPNMFSASTDDNVFVTDLNSDGLSDIVHIKSNGGTSQAATITNYYNQKTTAANTFFKNYSTTYITTIPSQVAIADFNGDGRGDLLSYEYGGQTAHLIAFDAAAPERALQEARDGFGNVTSFQHKTLTDYNAQTTAGFYTNSTGLQPHPFNTITAPIWAVQKVEAPNGISGGLRTQLYKYADAKFHRGGKGFLGFGVVESTENTSNISTKQITTFNQSLFVPSQTITEASGVLAGANVLLSRNKTDFAITAIGSAFHRYKSEVSKTRVEDKLKSTWVESTYQYDNYSNPINITTDKSGVEQEIVTTTYGSMSTSNTPCPVLPSSVTVSKSRGTMLPESTTTDYQNLFGYLNTTIQHAGLPLAVSTNYYYNTGGTVQSTYTWASGVTPRTCSLSYDSKYRFVTSKTNAAGQTESFVYDSRWGVPTSHTGIDGLTTTYQYDDLGRLIQTNTPDGNSSTASLAWNATPSLNTLYTATSATPGHGLTKVHYDALGRAKRMEAAISEMTVGSTTTPVFTLVDKTYNALGNLASETQPHLASETSGWLTTAFTYDGLGRALTTSNGIASSSNAYAYFHTLLYDNVEEVTTTNSAGQQTSKWTDGAGKLCFSGDGGGGVEYTYDSWGNVRSTRSAFTTTTSTQYNAYNRQTQLFDKNAGMTTYQYNAYGELTGQTDANGNTHTMVYNDLGQMNSRMGPEGITSYTYNPSGAAINQPASVTGFNSGYNEAYTYDLLGRLDTKSETFSGLSTTAVTSYTYDTWGRLATTTYPMSGPTITNQYNSYGGHTKVFYGTTALYELSGVNGRGQPLSAARGNGNGCGYSYTNSLLTNKSTWGIQNYSLVYNYTTGNITGRNDGIKILTETFAYDNLDRLTGAGVTTSAITYFPQMVTYDAVSGGKSHGNIASKTDVGAYKYLSAKPHAVSYVDNIPGNISTDTQNVTYTPFLKAATISENGMQQTLTYGHDYQRRKTELYNSSVLQETRYYLGEGAERHIDAAASWPANTKDIYYIPGPDGLAAIIYRDGGAESVYYPYTDHLGSIQALTDENGVVVYEQAFDAWGRYRDPATWLNGGAAEWTVPAQWAWLRGYTGHEHMPQFSLINMNGRVYDPLVGRMMSPDNYVQAPGFSQSYNRYSYCWNNPLKYTDPSGDFLFFTDLGYRLQKLFLPTAFQVKFDFGTHGNGVGFNYSIGMPQTSLISYRHEFGASYYGSRVGGYGSGWQTRSGGEWAVHLGNNTLRYGGTRYKDYDKNGNLVADQVNHTVSLNHSIGIDIAYSNDTKDGPFSYLGQDFADNVPFIPNLEKGKIGGYTSDRYRTASGRISIGLHEVGVFLHTGEGDNIYETFANEKPTSANFAGGSINDPKRSNGIMYLKSGGLSIGWDSEGVRHFWQNRVAHDRASIYPQNGTNYPYVLKTDRRPRFVFQYGGF